MPYIKQETRHQLDEYIDGLRKALADLEMDNLDGGNNTEGNLNYIISKLLADVYTHPLSYRNINDAVGMLECCKMELYRRLAFYEDQKIVENGDVYPNPHEMQE